MTSKLIACLWGMTLTFAAAGHPLPAGVCVAACWVLIGVHERDAQST